MHPRRLDFFLESLKNIDYVDVLLAKNMELATAMKAVKNYFLKNRYDYLLFTCDDITIPYLAPYKIMRDIEATGYDVITGWSPVGKELTNIGRPMTKEDIEKILKLGRRASIRQLKPFTVNGIEGLLGEGKRIVPIWFTGWSITAMSRRVVEAWTPKGWVFKKGAKWSPAVHNGQKGKWGKADVWFSYEIWKKGFKKYADLAVRVPHRKVGLKTLMVGKEPPKTELIKARKPWQTLKT